MDSKKDIALLIGDDNKSNKQNMENQQFLASSMTPPPRYEHAGRTVPPPQSLKFQPEPQQMGPVRANSRNLCSVIVKVIEEPAEAAVSRPLAIIALFCWCQVCFSIPAVIFAFKRNSTRSNYNKSIALSLIAIVLGMMISVAAIFLVALIKQSPHHAG